jgi:hypothetical protein
MGIKRTISFLSLLILSSVGSPVAGSGLGLVTGPGTGIGGDDTGIRELVHLQPVRDFLVGRPRDGVIERIVIDAPGKAATASTILIRQLETSDGLSTVLLSAPGSLEQVLRRLTVYIKKTTPDVVLLENKDDRWIIHRPQSMYVTDDTAQSRKKEILAFALDHLGLFWVVSSEGALGAVSDQLPSEPTADALLGGDIWRGFLPWILSGLLLLLVMSMSTMMHVVDKKRGR